MTPLVPATVVFGDVVGSRGDPGTTEFLRALRDDLEAAYGPRRVAPSGFTQGDELQLLLAPGADPFQAVLRAALRTDARGFRWAIVAGGGGAGAGAAAGGAGRAVLRAPAPPPRARRRRDGALGAGIPRRPRAPRASQDAARRPRGGHR